MDILTDEHEREEAVRKWWHEHWKPITLGVVITLAGLVGVRQYQAYQIGENQKDAYAAYQLQNQVASRGVAAFPEAEKFLDEHKDIYGAILALDMASVQMNGGKYAEAQQYIKFARDNGGELIAPQASLVLARLQAETGDYNGAFASLDAIRSDAYAAEVSEIRGDIYMAQKDINKAHDSYQQAIKITRDNKLQISPILQMKFDNVIRDGDEPAYKIMAEQIAESQIVPVSE